MKSGLNRNFSDVADGIPVPLDLPGMNLPPASPVVPRSHLEKEMGIAPVVRQRDKYAAARRK